jgi:hypothetical protein
MTTSDNGTLKVWEGGMDGKKYPVVDLTVECPVMAVCWGADGNTIHAGAWITKFTCVSLYYIVIQYSCFNFYL